MHKHIINMNLLPPSPEKTVGRTGIRTMGLPVRAPVCWGKLEAERASEEGRGGQERRGGEGRRGVEGSGGRDTRTRVAEAIGQGPTGQETGEGHLLTIEIGECSGM